MTHYTAYTVYDAAWKMKRIITLTIPQIYRIFQKKLYDYFRVIHYIHSLTASIFFQYYV